MNKVNTNKQMNEIGKLMQDMKVELNNMMEILLKNQIEFLEMKNSMSQLKNQLKDLSINESSRR
jgi:predicted  nucleic acid-binding Zn-ribbon protein